MSILFSVCFDNYQNLAKSSGRIITASQKSGVQITGKVKECFISLVSSISNSFLSLNKIFSFSNENKNVNSDKKDVILDGTSLKYSSQAEFDQLKTEMHTRLNTCFNNRSGA